jgi:hypothetical protein
MKGIRQAHVEEEEKKKRNVCNIFQEKRTYKPICYHNDQTYVHKEQTIKMS